MKVLFTTPVIEYPPADGPSLRICNSIRALNRVCELHILSRRHKQLMGGDKSELYYAKYCHAFEYAPSVKSNMSNNTQDKSKGIIGRIRCRGVELLRRIINKINYILNTDSNYIVDYVKKNNIDIIWFGFGSISFDLMKSVKCKLPNIKIVCDTDSVWSRFILRELNTLNGIINKKKIIKEGQKKEAEEKAWQHFVDVTTAVSEIDAEYYRKIAKNTKNIKIFSNVIDPEMYSIIPPTPPNYKNPCIYLAGSFWERCPMEHASRWLIKEVLPIIRKSIPDIHLYIIGKNSDYILSDVKDPGITITGIVDSVLPYLCHANVALVPLFFESGTRFKILEAAASGIPIVSTTLGAEGIPVRDGIDILIADEPNTFALAIIEIIKNKNFGDMLAGNCKDLVKNNYSIDSLVNEANEIISYLS